jgi:hypothetical protein
MDGKTDEASLHLDALDLDGTGKGRSPDAPIAHQQATGEGCESERKLT